MYDVIALGELLIDLTPAGFSKNGNVLFERNPGGAPANVLAALSKLGGKGSFIGKVGNDRFGHFLRNIMAGLGIGVEQLKYSDEVNTTLAVVHLDENGDRSFSFYRNPGADMLLNKNEIDFSILKKTKIFQFGSASLTDEPVRSAVSEAIEYAKRNNRIIAYDPNWRPSLWKDKKEAKDIISEKLKYTDILKISEEELEFLTGKSDLKDGSKNLIDMGIRLVVVTLGPKGCFFRCEAGMVHMDTYDVKVVDTTGAGDAFLGALLFYLCSENIDLDNISREQLEHMMDFSNAVGALCASRMGAIPAMPSMVEVKECMRTVPKLLSQL